MIFMKRAATFVGTLLFAAAIVWLSGYNFDHRSPEVAVVALIVVAAAAFFASYPFEDMRHD